MLRDFLLNELLEEFLKNLQKMLDDFLEGAKNLKGVPGSTLKEFLGGLPREFLCGIPDGLPR